MSTQNTIKKRILKFLLPLLIVTVSVASIWAWIETDKVDFDAGDLTKLDTDTFVNSVTLESFLEKSESGYLLSDDFNDGDYNGWTVKSGNWTVAAGALRCNNSSGNIVNGSKYWENYGMQIRMETVNRGSETYDVAKALFSYRDDTSIWAIMLVDDTPNPKLELTYIDGGPNWIPNVSVALPASSFAGWHDYYIYINGNNVKIYFDGNLEIDYNHGSNIPNGMAGCRSDDALRVDFDDVKVFKSPFVTISQLSPGQKVEMYNTFNVLLAQATVPIGQTQAAINAGDVAFPFNGYFKIYGTDGITLVKQTGNFTNIWGGDIYKFRYYSGNRVNSVSDSSAMDFDALTRTDVIVSSLGDVELGKGMSDTTHKLPAGRRDMAAACDTSLNKVYLFAGTTLANGYTTQIIEYDIAASTNAVNIGNLPGPYVNDSGPRRCMSAVYVPGNDRIYVFGGEGFWNFWAPRWARQILEYKNGLGFTNIIPNGMIFVGGGDGGRSATSSAYDSANNKIYIIGGHTWGTPTTRQILWYTPGVLGANCATLIANMATWKERTSAVYCDANGNTYIFGGKIDDCFTKVYSNQIIQITPPGALAILGVQLTSARGGTSAAYSPDNQKIYIFGGENGSNAFKDILEFDPIAFSIAKVGEMPSPRYGTAAAYSPATKLIYVFGGYDPVTSTYYDDILAFQPLYTLSGTLESDTVSTTHPITAVTPSWNATLNGQPMDVYISVDGGSWVGPVSNGTGYNFAWNASNKALKYKVEFTSLTGVKSPVLHDIALLYTTSEQVAPLEAVLISQTYDTSREYKTISWQGDWPAEAGTDSLKFQIATSTWIAPAPVWATLFKGPAGSTTTYYTNNLGETIDPGHSGDRYAKYKGIFTSIHDGYAPRLDDITINEGPPRITQQFMYHRETGTGPWSASSPANTGNDEIYNNEEVMIESGIYPGSNGANSSMRFYYTVSRSTTTTASYPVAPFTINDTGGNEATTDFYVNGVYDSTVGSWDIYISSGYASSYFPEELHSCGTYVKVVPCGTPDNGVLWIDSDYDMMYKATEEPGSPAGDKQGAATYVLKGRGTFTKPYPLKYESDGDFLAVLEQDYSAIRHAPLSPLTTAPLSTEYYFMPGGTVANDNLSLNANGFSIAGADSMGDIFYSEDPNLYVRASYGDICDSATVIVDTTTVAYKRSVDVSYNYDAWLDYYNRGIDNWVETIQPNKLADGLTPATTTQTKQGFYLHYDFLRANAGDNDSDGISLDSLPEGTTVQYHFQLSDDDGSGSTGATKYLYKNGVQDTEAGTDFTYCILQDDLSRPAAITHPLPAGGTVPFLATINIKIQDISDGDKDVYNNPGFSNVISGRGTNSGIYSNPASTGTLTSPVHDTRVYYKSYDVFQATISVAGEGNYASTSDLVKAMECGDATDNFDGYMSMSSGAVADEWTAAGTFTPNKHLYYRIYACNNDADPQSKVSPSDNSGGSVGANDSGGTNNNHGVVGTDCIAPYGNLAKDIDRDHGWVTPTRYGGMVEAPKMVEITAGVEDVKGNMKRKIITRISVEGGTVGSVISQELP